MQYFTHILTQEEGTIAAFQNSPSLVSISLKQCFSTHHIFISVRALTQNWTKVHLQPQISLKQCLTNQIWLLSPDSPYAIVYSLWQFTHFCLICRSRLWLNECRYFLLRPARFETKTWLSFHLNPPSLIGKLNPNLFTQGLSNHFRAQLRPKSWDNCCAKIRFSLN